MAAFKTLQFLPEIFRTDPNRKFLNATVDQLVSEPTLIKVNGYIGRKLAPSYKASDTYITEPTKSRQDYQLEPSIVIKDSNTDELIFATTYTDIVNKVNFYGGFGDNQNRLFDNEYYSYNPQIDLDKFVNFAQYYWLENGPAAVLVSASAVPLEATFTVTFDTTTQTYRISGFNDALNPVITLARGGSYTFVNNEPNNKFYIQTSPGVLGTDPNAPNLTTRTILGVTNNGQDVGDTVFQVPLAASQVQWTSMLVVDNVNYATGLSYQALQGCLVSDFENVLGGLDGPTLSLEDSTVVFVNNEFIDDTYWHNIARTENNVIYLDQDVLIPLNQRNNIYQINVLEDDQGDARIYLTNKFNVNNEQKVRIVAGAVNAGKEFYSRLDIYNEVPAITAPLNLLYYQSNQTDNAVGAIQLIDPAAGEIDPELEIIGQPTYTSPGGIVFTNGLKITFDSTVTAPYANKTYYIEGVGTAIVLVLVDNLICPELDNVSNPDYLTINRGSADLNGWSRSNRWFHVAVIESTAQYNGTDLILNQTNRAQRPIIEFSPNLQLYNFGAEAKNPVDILDDVITNAYLQVQGVICPYIAPDAPTELTVTIGDKSITLTDGDRVIFSQDENLDVRNKIYNFSIELTTEAPDPLVYRAYIQEASDATVEERQTIIVTSGDNGEKQWYFNGTIWIESQQKTSINQAPLFDIINQQGVSFGDSLVYSGSTFAGNKLFSYKIGTGTNDSVLGFPLSYKNLITQGDIQFENNFDLDTFDYILSAGVTETLAINTGLIQENLSRTTSTRLNTWVINSRFSQQYQIFNFTYDGTTNLFPIDILPDISVDVPNIKVIINSTPVANGQFGITKVVDKLALLVDPSLLTANDAVFVTIFNSKSTSTQGFYQVPVNFDINSLNTDVETLTLGQIRNHLIEYKNNSLDIVGGVPGNSNLRDISYQNRGGSILQHSAPIIYAGLFLNHPEMNFVDSLRLASREYSQFKIKFLEAAANLELDQTNIAACVDTIMASLNSVKNDTFPYHYSDMIPHGEDERIDIPSYTVFDTDIRAYEITTIFNDTVVGNKAILVYLTRQLDGSTTTTLLVKGQDYYFDQNRPAVVIQDSFNLLYNDIISIVEYNNTDGSYVPETPTKLGLYPKYVPEIFIDNTYRTPRQVIQGHDGSLTPAFGDFRDSILLELERRIYNNIKAEYNVFNFNINDYTPGKFRLLDYTRQEFNQLLSQSFLKWVGTNRVDFTTNNTFQASDAFTWNYRKFRDVVNGESLTGTWRSVFRYFFDTDRPHTHPWEMLGFSEKPDYWNDRYGPAPYTGGNIVLWGDLESGYIHAGTRAGIDLRYSRPGLTGIIPVDENGNLRSPAEFLVTDFDSANANTSFAVGDIGPTELAWRRSSDFPFAVQYALAIGKPARYFSLLADVQKYFRNPTTGQFIDSVSNKHIQPNIIRVNGYLQSDGTIERSAGYINWIRDYLKNIGIGDAGTVIKDNLDKMTVQLAYKMAGYSDKRFLELLAEQVSPSSINDSVVIPEENYRIELYKGAPLNKITYSAVIIEKSVNGYTVSGYDITNPYFYIIPSLPNNNSYVIEVDGQRGTIFRDYKTQRFTIPYGFEFTSKQQVVDFLVSYQRYLIAQGFVFEDRDNLLNEKKDWVLSAKEFLHWSKQGWRTGNIIVLSPVSTSIKVFNETAVVDEIANTSNGSRVLDINYQAINKNNFTVIRDSNLFTFNSLNEQTIGLAELSLVQYEHLLLLDNTTVFRDVIYVPETGNRQYRLKLVGSKTGFWNGGVELPGYFYSKDQVDEWLPGKDYLKGSIVSHKVRVYTAIENISAADQFQTALWKQLALNELKSGVINNFATNASQSLRYYDINDQPLDEKIQLFSNGLIGFRPRQYFTNLGIDITTQSKFYQGLIKQGGTTNAINALKGAQFNNLNTDLNFFENWMIRVGEYGALDINNFYEFILPDSEFDNNPAVFQLTDGTTPAQTDITTFNQANTYKLSGNFEANFLRTESQDQPLELRPLPVAGFVNLDDIDGTIFNIQDYASYPDIVNNIGTGYTLWTARDFDNEWNVYRASSVPGVAFILRYSTDSQAELVMSAEHGLEAGNLIALKNFDPKYNGIYRVDSIIDSTRFLITIYNNLQDLIDAEAVIANGLVYKLQSSKLATPTAVITNTPNDGWLFDDKIWVESLDDQENWGVYTKTDPWQYQNKIQLGESQYAGNDHFGRAIALDAAGLFLYGGAPDSSNGRVSIYTRNTNNAWDSYGFLWGNNAVLDSFGKVLATATIENSNYLAVAAPDSGSKQGVVYVFENQVLIQILADSLGAASDEFGASLAMSDDAKYLYIGAPGANKVYCYALNYPREPVAQNIIGSTAVTTFNLNFASTAASDIIVTSPLRSAEYFPGIDYTVASGPDRIIFTVAPANGDRITVQKRTYYYSLLDTLPVSSESIAGSQFGSSVVCNSDGSTIAVGASATTVDGLENAGAVYVYHRTVTEFITNGITNTFTLPDNLGNVYRVYFNNQLIYDPTNAPTTTPPYTPDYYTIGTSIIQYGGSGDPTVAAGNTLKVESNQFVLDQTIYPESVGIAGGSFGAQLTMCNSGCNLYVSSPTYLEANYRFGLVTRYVNVGRVYGSVTGSVQNPTVSVGESIIINNRVVTFTGTTLASVVSNINGGNIPGVTASIIDNRLNISSDVVVAANKLNIVAGNFGTPLADLGLDDYKHVQTIQHPDTLGETFGSALKVDQASGTLAISSDGADINIPIEIDSALGTPTLFDSGGTKFVDIITDSGAVYIYNLMTNPYEDVDNPSLYAFTQKLVGPELDTGFNFGAAIDLKFEYLIVGVSNDYNIVTEGGSLYYYYNQNAKSGWTLTRYKEPRVDIGAVNSSFLYNTVSQNTLDFFDYLDPAKGKLLGAVEQELDYKEEYDPASYNRSNRLETINNPNFYWSDRQVGKTWWDLSVVSFIDYEQDILQYRVKNWASLFPGSQVTIYEWVESDYLPSQYADAVGDGIARYPDDTAFSSVTVVDPTTGIINQKYYYWVSGKTNVDINQARRTLSVKALESYITSPKDQGIPYLALLAPNAVAVFNITNQLVGNDVAIHLDVAETRNSNLIHNEWQLVQQNASAESIPQRFIDKLKDSIVGFDTRGSIVPDPLLKAQDRLGILNSPRQTLMVNRLGALQNYVQTLNTILQNYPILLITTPSSLFLEEPLPTTGFDTQTNNVTDLLYLNTEAFPNAYKILVPSDSTYEGKWSIYSFNSTNDTFELFKLQSYKTELFWNSTVWYDTTYQNGKDINYTVNIYSDIQALTPAIGDYIKVLDNGQGKWLLYEVQNDSTLNLIGAENGTLQVSEEVYDVTIGAGYDSAVYDSVGFDPQAVQELQNIYDSVYQEILIGNLSTELNRLFLTIVNYIFAEQKSPDWIFKTSFIDVYHNLRTLEQFPNYVRDNQSFYNDYIEEVKPYRTQIREYVPSYLKQDTAQGDWTDFDLPSAYDARYNVFRSPDILLSSDIELFENELYSDWSNNYKFKITDYIIGNVGLNYTLPPNVEITGGGGTGAAAVTTINANGQVSGITVTNPGSGYTSTPNVFINGDGVGATAYSLLKNEFYNSQANLSYNLVRSIDTQIKFDRLSYFSNLVVWQPNIAYANTVVNAGNTTVDIGNIYLSSGNIIVYNNQAYLATNANVSTQSIFDFTRFSQIDSGNVLLDAVDRIVAYYEPEIGMPGKNLAQLITNLEYPGVNVQGTQFRANAFEITSNIISFNYTGLTIDSGNVEAVNFQTLGFEIDQSIRIEALVPFEFQNNGYFTIINVDRDSMTLTGQPVETTYKLFLGNSITANAGDYITQANTLANAYVLQSVTNSKQLDVIYTVPEFTESANIISINGVTTSANILEVATGGNANVTISYLNLQTVLDSNIYSTYLDTALGTRPQDINIVGGAYVDAYASHAPEELVPGRMYDAVEMNVFSNTTGNTATYGFRVFQPMSANIEYTRISANSTTTLSANLALTDDEILVTDVTKLPTPAPDTATPGVVFVNGERIVYYQKYDFAKMSTAIAWTANTQIPVDTLIALDSNVYLTQGNVYANANVYVNSANIQLIKLNSLRQLRRGVDGTGVANIVLAGNLVSDSSQAQLIPNSSVFATTVNDNLRTADYVTYKLELTAAITANVGDYITQFSNANVRVLESVSNSRVVAVNLDSQPWRANLVTGTIFGNLDVNSQDTTMIDLFFKSDGTKMYTTGQTNDRVYEYTLGTPWNVATASNVAAVSLSAQETAPTGLFFKPDGTKMYVIGTTNDRVYEYTLSTPWQVNTASNVGASVATSSGGSSESAPGALFFRPNGSSYYIIGTGADRVKRYDMTTPWQVNTAAYYSQSAAITSIETTSAGLSFHPAGLKMFVVGNTNDQIREYDLATAWDPTTITLVANSSVLSGAAPAPQGMFWKPDGTSVYIVDSTLNAVSEYQVIAPFVTGNAVAKRANIVTSSGTTNTTANVVSFAPLGAISAYSTVYVNQTILQSNIWEQFGTTLQNSTTTGAQFIRAEPSYTP
jgi:sugar lactone lactonase YvrE